jgi:crossover junction endodeoxyribonuclease RuvC
VSEMVNGSGLNPEGETLESSTLSSRTDGILDLFLGIDPGTQGAAAVVNQHGELVDYIRFSKLTELDIAEWVARWAPQIKTAILERVGSMPGQGVASTFKFGSAYGFVRGLLVANRIPWDYASPVVWQRAMGCLSKGNKNVVKAKAQRLWPTHHKWTLEEPDACLIAAFCVKREL